MVQKNSLKKPKVIAIIGPTASGKSSLAVYLAKHFNGEIISADSMQVYKGLDVGTAKITNKEMDGVVHHLLDVSSPNERFTAADWKQKAEDAVNDILSRGKLPIIAGGTGLYISSLLYGYDFYNAKEDFSLRDKYLIELKEKGVEYLYNLLKEKSPELASKVEKNKSRQVIRYLEIAENGDCKNSSLEKKEKYNYLLLGLLVPREQLYERINKRVDEMVANGLEKEVNGLLEQGLDLSSQAALAIGYKEVIEYKNGKTSLETAIELIKQHSRNYAKRQLTWMRKMKGLVWVNPFDKENIKNLVSEFLLSKEN